MLIHQMLILGGVAGIGQRHQGLTGGDLLTNTDGDPGHGAGVGEGIPGAVNVQRSGAQVRTVFQGYLDSLLWGIVLVLHGDGKLSLNVGFHGAGDLGAVLQGDDNRGVNGQIRVCLHLNRHFVVQGQHRQGTVFQHYIGNQIIFLGVNHLYRARGQGGDGGGCGIGTGGADFIGQVVQRFLNLGDGVHHTDPVHGGNGLPFRDAVAIAYQVLRDFHIRGDVQAQRPFPGEQAAAQNLGFQLLTGDLAGENGCLGGIICAAGRHGHYRQQNHQGGGTAPGDVTPPLLFELFFHRLILHSAGRRWASSWQPCWQGTGRTPAR